MRAARVRENARDMPLRFSEVGPALAGSKAKLVDLLRNQQIGCAKRAGFRYHSRS